MTIEQDIQIIENNPYGAIGGAWTRICAAALLGETIEAMPDNTSLYRVESEHWQVHTGGSSIYRRP